MTAALARMAGVGYREFAFILNPPLYFPRASEAKKCQFSMGWDPLWAWVCSVLDPQDSIEKLFKCVLRVVGQKAAARCGPPLLKLWST
jgi:hypothetical protein